MNRDGVDILLVEDNPSDVELSLYALRKNKNIQNIKVVRDGVDALDYIFCTGQYSNRRITATPRLILLDLKLPRLDGVDVLRRIKADPRTSHIPIVILTSSREERDLVECYKLGVNSYVVKPIDFEKFTESVQNLGVYWVELNEMPVRMENGADHEKRHG